MVDEGWWRHLHVTKNKNTHTHNNTRITEDEEKSSTTNKLNQAFPIRKLFKFICFIWVLNRVVLVFKAMDTCEGINNIRQNLTTRRQFLLAAMSKANEKLDIIWAPDSNVGCITIAHGNNDCAVCPLNQFRHSCNTYSFCRTEENRGNMSWSLTLPTNTPLCLQSQLIKCLKIPFVLFGARWSTSTPDTVLTKIQCI